MLTLVEPLPQPTLDDYLYGYREARRNMDGPVPAGVPEEFVREVRAELAMCRRRLLGLPLARSDVGRKHRYTRGVCACGCPWDYQRDGCKNCAERNRMRVAAGKPPLEPLAPSDPVAYPAST
jgi:hypothetical protein